MEDYVMIEKPIICKDICNYEGMITRGKGYKALEMDDNQKIVRIWTDNGRKRWFPYYCFELDGKDVPVLMDWKFDDEVTEDTNESNWIEISFTLSDGTTRWSILYTPERLTNALMEANIDPPGIHIQHMIVVRSYEKKDISRVLKYLDDHDELISASRLLSPMAEDIED